MSVGGNSIARTVPLLTGTHLRTLIAILIIVSSSTVRADDDVSNLKTDGKTCLGQNREETLIALRFIRQSVECADAGSMQECRDNVGIEHALIAVAGSAGATASLRAHAKSLCKAPTVGLFGAIAVAAPMSCPLDNQKYHRAAMETLKDFDDEATKRISEIENGMNLSRQMVDSRSRLADVRGRLSELNRKLLQEPETLVQSDADRRAKKPLTEDQKKLAREKLKEVEKAMAELDKVKDRGPTVIDDAIKAHYNFDLYKGLSSNHVTGQIMNGPEKPSAAKAFLDSIRSLPLAEQKQKIAARLKEFPELAGYQDDIYRLEAVQGEQRAVRTSISLIKPMGAARPDQIARQLSHVSRFTAPRSYELSRLGRAAARLNSFSHSLRAATSAVGKGAFNAGRRAAGFVGRSAVGKVVGAAMVSPHVMAAEVAVHIPSTGCEKVLGGRYATYDKDCNVIPVLGESTLDLLFNQDDDVQFNEVYSNTALCEALKEIYTSLGPGSWKAECTSRGFKLTAKNSENPFAIDFQTDEEGKLSQMRYLNSVKVRPGYSNFAVRFDSNERPREFLALPKADRLDELSYFEFNDPKKYPVIPAGNALAQKRRNNLYGYLREGYDNFEGVRLAATQVQMCCTKTDVTTGEDAQLAAAAAEEMRKMCGAWGLDAQSSSRSPSGGPNQGGSRTR